MRFLFLCANLFEMIGIIFYMNSYIKDRSINIIRLQENI